MCWVIGGCNAVFGQHSKCHLNSTVTLLYSLSVLLMESVPVLLLKNKKVNSEGFFHNHMITQDRNLPTCPLLGPPPVHLTLFHFCWPGWKLKWTKTEQQFNKVCSRWLSAKARPETHFHNYNFNLDIRWQIHFRLETSHHGNQQMNSGQRVFVVNDWQITHTHTKSTSTDTTDFITNQCGSKEIVTLMHFTSNCLHPKHKGLTGNYRALFLCHCL